MLLLERIPNRNLVDAFHLHERSGSPAMGHVFFKDRRRRRGGRRVPPRLDRWPQAAARDVIKGGGQPVVVSTAWRGKRGRVGEMGAGSGAEVERGRE